MTSPSVPELILLCQAALGVERDGKAGLITWGAVYAALAARHGDIPAVPVSVPMSAAEARFDERTEKLLATLDPKAIDRFRHFICVSKGIAAQFGCDYRMVSGYRTWDEQAALKKISDAGGAHAAAAGGSWHNFKLAGDFGVFRLIAGKWVYLDGGSPAQQAIAEKVHAAIGALAQSLGMQWGGTWKGKSQDTPHFQIDMGRSSPSAADSALFQQKGSVL